jgi:peptidoglycan-associated lipoprotein
MIVKSLLIVTTGLTLLLTGCSQKAPELNAAQTGKNNVSDATEIAGETVSINENTYGNENNSSHGQNGMNDGKYNSSGNGFQSIYFGFGDYGISPEMENHITSNANVLQNSHAKVKIEGNCDEFGTDEYNYALGLKRAKAVKDSLVAQGAPAGKMVIISYGESNPVCSNPTDGCYAQNRRVDLRLAK